MPDPTHLTSSTMIGCSERMGCPGMPLAEYGPATWILPRRPTTSDVLSTAAGESCRLSRSIGPRITVFSGFYSGSPGLEHERERALSKSFGDFPFPSAGKAVIDSIAWVPVSPTVSRERLAAGIRAEVEHLSSSQACDDSPADEDDGSQAAPASVPWFLFLWPAEAFGFTPEQGAAFVAEAAFGIGATLPVPLSQPKNRSRRRRKPNGSKA